MRPITRRKAEYTTTCRALSPLSPAAVGRPTRTPGKPYLSGVALWISVSLKEFAALNNSNFNTVLAVRGRAGGFLPPYVAHFSFMLRINSIDSFMLSALPR